MPKLKKSETLALASNQARLHSTAKLTWKELEDEPYADYRKRAETARNIAKVAAATNPPESNYFDEYVVEFADTLLKVWGATLEARRTSLRNWQKRLEAARQMPLKKCVDFMVARGQEMAKTIYGASCENNYGGLRFNINKLGWGLTGDIRVNFMTDFDKKAVNPDNEQECVGHYLVSVDISWPSSTRGLAASVAAAALIRELVEVAALLEALARELGPCYAWPESLLTPVVRCPDHNMILPVGMSCGECAVDPQRDTVAKNDDYVARFIPKAEVTV